MKVIQGPETASRGTHKEAIQMDSSSLDADRGHLPMLFPTDLLGRFSSLSIQRKQNLVNVATCHQRGRMPMRRADTALDLEDAS